MLLFIVSILSGIISGMGIGGGTILIPALTVLFKLDQHTSQSINLLSFIPIGGVALITHIRNKNVDTRLALKLIIPGIIGAVSGSMLSSHMSSPHLRKLFGVFLFVMGLYEVTCRRR